MAAFRILHLELNGRSGVDAAQQKCAPVLPLGRHFDILKAVNPLWPWQRRERVGCCLSSF
jgi:hypothetical protein